MIDKRNLVEQLCARLRASAIAAAKAGELAAEEARNGATPAEKREDARVLLENAGLARGQVQRAERARADLSALEVFRPQELAATAAIALGAVVEVEDEEGGRTFFLAPAGAGEELSGPDGDGFLSVVTPASPVGRAVLGRRKGETVEVTVKGEVREWTITFVG
ncbi:MAG: GreA/GreB family elongation factor [Myxococcaceae bacterium]